MNRHDTPLFKEGQPKEVVIFDIDGTLTRDTPDELSGRVYWHMHENNLLHPDQSISPGELIDLRNEYLENPTDMTHRRYLLRLNQAFDKQAVNRQPSTMKRIAHSALSAESTLIYPSLMKEVAYWHEQEVPIIVASGSPRIILDPIMDRIGARIGIGSHYARTGNRFHPYKRCESRGGDKKAYLQSVLTSLSLTAMSNEQRSQLDYEGHRPTYESLADEDKVTVLAGYGNTTSDFGIFELAQQPVVVNPRGSLRVVATVNHWRTLLPEDDTLTPLKLAA